MGICSPKKRCGRLGKGLSHAPRSTSAIAHTRLTLFFYIASDWIWKSADDLQRHKRIDIYEDQLISHILVKQGFLPVDYSGVSPFAVKGVTKEMADDACVLASDEKVGAEVGGHGGGDKRVVSAWLDAIRLGDPSLVTTDVHESLRTHSIVFAAEQSRRERRMIDMAEIYAAPVST